ncbi:hypothetical protein POM88_051774 [Heracleum sosnowskyi]|uniref:Uncharacterized protein n=1 Tax=Heracleum sosnowskyi TaxID=360622 RepID=A0AAD8M410_9APIA|nr:hypothetical protein POM88_051774 [Heracleum sosnowskyi]
MNHSDNNETTSSESELTVTAKLEIETEEELAKCECCGFTEECTQTYMTMIRQRYQAMRHILRRGMYPRKLGRLNPSDSSVPALSPSSQLDQNHEEELNSISISRAEF